MTVMGCAEEQELQEDARKAQRSRRSVLDLRSSFKAGGRCAPVGGDGGYPHFSRSNHEWSVTQGICTQKCFSEKVTSKGQLLDENVSSKERFFLKIRDS